MDSSDQSILIVDIETTGFLDQGGKIVEVGIVKLNLNSGKISVVFNSLVKEEGFDISHTRDPFGWIFKNSDLTFEEINSAPSLESQRDIIQNLFDRYPATAYNKEFDFGFLKKRGFVMRELPCPMILLTDIIKLPSPSGYGYKWPKVEEAWKYFFGTTAYNEAHRALDDAIHEAKIVHQLFKKGFIKTAEMEFYHHIMCQFCHDNIITKGCEINQILYKKIKKGNLFKDAQYISTVLEIPMCNDCKMRLQNEKNSDNSIIIISVIICVIIFSLIPIIYNGYIFSGLLLGAFVGFFVGAFVKTYLRSHRNRKRKVTSNILSHPFVIEKINKGWSTTEP